MLKRTGPPASVIVPLLLAGFFAGLLVAGRVRAARDGKVPVLLGDGQGPVLLRDGKGPVLRDGKGFVEDRAVASSPAPGPSESPSATSPRSASAATPERASSTGPAPAAAAVGPDFTGIAGRAVKGVANISSLQVVRTNSPFASDPFFRYFFGDEDVFGPRDQRSLSLGSGVIISPDGYVVTNNHVVGEHVSEITISLPDKREITGKLIGTDPATDIALVKINTRGLPVVPWGDSSQLKVGEWVLAIGSPYQLNQTVTAGIVSATGRTGLGFADYEDFIQTDAAINRGNSGGALINTRGELVGINTGIFSESGGYQGIGFAVPSNLARRITDDLMRYGEVRRGSIGYLRVEKLSPQIAEELGLRSTKGALVIRPMIRSSPAYQAGIQPFDVITEFDGHPVEDPSHLSRLVSDAKIGSTITLTVMRKSRAFKVRLPIASSASQARRRG